MQYLKRFKKGNLIILFDKMPISITFYFILDLNYSKELNINIHKYRFKIVYYKR